MIDYAMSVATQVECMVDNSNAVPQAGLEVIVVTNNSYPDILSGLVAELAGGRGTAASANFNPATGLASSMPVHRSAPDIAGMGMANPVGAIASAALRLQPWGTPSPPSPWTSLSARR